MKPVQIDPQTKYHEINLNYLIGFISAKSRILFSFLFTGVLRILLNSNINIHNSLSHCFQFFLVYFLKTSPILRHFSLPQSKYDVMIPVDPTYIK